MVAYRLHFEKANMEVVERIKNGSIGEPKIFNSSFTMQIREGNIRTQSAHGGGPLYDIGIYCINAARYLFQSEPIEVTAFSTASKDPRFQEIEESVGCVMRFPENKLALFACSFGAADTSHYEVIGTKGSITLDPAYEYVDALRASIKVGDEKEEVVTPKHDQFAPELLYFADCILTDTDPKPSGFEGINDITIIQSIQESINFKRAVSLRPIGISAKPDVTMVEEKPPVAKPPLVKVAPASQ